MPQSHTRAAHAKINLALAVAPPIDAPGPTRGYHPIASWFSAIDLADDIELTLAPTPNSVRHTIEWASDAPRPTPIDWDPAKDLGVRALAALGERLGVNLPVSIACTKRIPVGAGLGGGSSDAAQVLLGVRKLLGLDVPTTDLCTIARSLGADVSFFIDDVTARAPRPAIVTGFGEGLERIAPTPADLLLLVPAFPIATGPVYGAFDAMLAEHDHTFRADAPAHLARRAATDIAIPDTDLFNDLAAPAERVEPRLGELRRALTDALDRPVHITGSGSAMFCVAREGDDPHAIDDRFQGLATLHVRTL